MIRVLLDARQTVESTAPDAPESVPCQPGDVVVQRRGSGYYVFRYAPEAAETAELCFVSLGAALTGAREAQRGCGPLAALWEPRRRPTPDERAGMAWFNGLNEAARRHWLERARVDAQRTCPYDASAAEAWAAFKCRRGRLRVVDSA